MLIDTPVDNRNSLLLSTEVITVLLIKEARFIKQLKPLLNHGLMASKDLQLFSLYFVNFAFLLCHIDENYYWFVKSAQLIIKSAT